MRIARRLAMAQGISQQPCRRSHVIPTGLLRATLIGSILASPAIAAQPVEGHVVNAATGAGIPGVSVRLFPSGDFSGPFVRNRESLLNHHGLRRPISD